MARSTTRAAIRSRPCPRPRSERRARDGCYDPAVLGRSASSSVPSLADPRSGILRCALVALLTGLAAPAAAQPEATTEDAEETRDDAAPRDRALALYSAARTLDGQGRTEDAIPLAEEAYRLYPSGGVRFALGALHERLGHRDEAVRHYRMALGEPRAPRPEVARQIAEALTRLGADPTPLEPEPLPGTEPEAAEVAATDGAAEAPAEDLEAPAEAQTPPPPPAIASGLRLSATVFADLTHVGSAWGAAGAIGWVFDVGAFVELELNGPHFTAVLTGGVEIGDWLVRPIAAAFVAVSPLRTFDDDASAAVLVGPRLGAALHPFDELPLSFALSASLAIDLTRAGEGFVFTVPLALGVRWVFA